MKTVRTVFVAAIFALTFSSLAFAQQNPDFEQILAQTAENSRFSTLR